MAQTTILEERNDSFNGATGEIEQFTRRKVVKSKIEPTDEFFKVTRYLNTIYAYNNIPQRLVGISLCFGQLMEFRTNKLYLLKANKLEIAEMLGCSFERVTHLISECRKYDIIRPVSRGVYEVNGFLFSSGTIADTRNIQAHFNFESGEAVVTGDMYNHITGETVRKAVADKKNQIPGQLSFANALEKLTEAEDD